MKGEYTALVTENINAPVEKVWKAITTPELISKYLYGTKVNSDWKEGGYITYDGVHNGTKYHDRGTIKKIEPNKVFASTYWSSMSGKDDTPENHHLVIYTLSEGGGVTHVMVSQDNIATEAEKAHSEKNWKMTLNELKKVVEGME